MNGDSSKSAKFQRIQRQDLVLPELSYQIVGALYDVHNSLGPGHLERVYQRAVALALQKRHITFEEQVLVPLLFEKKPVGTIFFGFPDYEPSRIRIKAG